MLCTAHLHSQVMPRLVQGPQFEKQSPNHDSQMGGLAQPKSHHPGGQKQLGFWKTLTSLGH